MNLRALAPESESTSYPLTTRPPPSQRPRAGYKGKILLWNKLIVKWTCPAQLGSINEAQNGRKLCDFKRSLYMHFSSSWACGHSVPARQLNLIGNEGQTKCESTIFFLIYNSFFLSPTLHVVYFLIFWFDFLLIFFRAALIFSSAAKLAAMLSKWVN